ncbi:hypothetical protein PKNA1_C2_0215700 [Plasmodium knowlesi strain H]|uniref:Uncharacterized protein n=3 Tax=Plasmodium knowlesi TaxID=5850 RepID=A0A1A7W5W6_PLAKH|nr:uncharacterized protein PKNH_0215700 [Plasmodium knowlesi strain H]OTN66347.1 Uncharacterized protein PKNOH_S09525800 [Plasmodium knowlesi]CAA9986421.1 hypothetical protein PKNH_0215700 [Plasmodium knowlesi strain H]SBO27174.1 hypothetical protein PKNA1_C2_0215700 [Plasmodium knowlesi strain H]SBO29556.1 hypothetical protein PKNA1_H1_0215700 [Plasmodium knowlesi strain H]VVS75895.1 hypothetical protein PKNH_0215700 [Plasmodium knowlesi strain H]
MEREGVMDRGKTEENSFEKIKGINNEDFKFDDPFTEKITNDSKLFDEAEYSSSHVGKEEEAYIRKRQIGKKIKKVNNTSKIMEVRFYIFLVLLICFYSLLVNIIRKGLGLVSVAHRLMHSHSGNISM